MYGQKGRDRGTLRVVMLDDAKDFLSYHSDTRQLSTKKAVWTLASLSLRGSRSKEKADFFTLRCTLANRIRTFGIERCFAACFELQPSHCFQYVGNDRNSPSGIRNLALLEGMLSLG